MAAGYSTAGVSVKIRRKARNEWLTLKPNTHEGYVSWEKFEAIRTISSNVPTGRHHGAPKHGDALLAGLIWCKRCGRKLTLRYSGMALYHATAAAAPGWTMAGPTASPSADCVSMMPAVAEEFVTSLQIALIALAGRGFYLLPSHVHLNISISGKRPRVKINESGMGDGTVTVELGIRGEMPGAHLRRWSSETLAPIAGALNLLSVVPIDRWNP
ncbi:hypothetical protein ACVWYQ_003199 [Bradyrhizobium sp. USDA 3397]